MLATKVTHVAFYYKVAYVKIAQKVSQYLGRFNEKICYLEISKIAQSGHTALKSGNPSLNSVGKVQRRTIIICTFPSAAILFYFIDRSVKLAILFELNRPLEQTKESQTLQASIFLFFMLYRYDLAPDYFTFEST